MSQEPTPISAAIYSEPITKRAAALLSVGVPFFSENDRERTTNIYSENKPYREGKPGEVTYLLATKTDYGTPTAELAEAYDAKDFTPAIELDRLVDEIERAVPHLGQKLRKLLPRAIMAYLRGGFENRERILDLWKRAIPMVLIRKSENSFSLVHRNASEKTLRRFGLK